MYKCKVATVPTHLETCSWVTLNDSANWTSAKCFSQKPLKILLWLLLTEKRLTVVKIHDGCSPKMSIYTHEPVQQDINSLNVLAIPNVMFSTVVNLKGLRVSYWRRAGIGRNLKSSFPPCSYFSSSFGGLSGMATSRTLLAFVVVPDNVGPADIVKAE